MKRKLYKYLCVMILIFLMPYIITRVINGEFLNNRNAGNSPVVSVLKNQKIQEMKLADYGIGVLASEMEASYEKEALKAQAILIRTSVYSAIKTDGSNVTLKKKYWTRSQMKNNWGKENAEEYYKKIKSAWEETEGKVLIYEGGLAFVPFHRVSNGKTRNGKDVLGTDQYPYLMSKECPEDLKAKEAMTVQWIQGNHMEIARTDSAGYVLEVTCGKERITGDAYRETYHLPSACFYLEPMEGQTKVISNGIGHGLGMSQYTANRMAKEGKSYEEILNYFYEGTQIQEVAEILVKTE